jgi:NTE family protein
VPVDIVVGTSAGSIVGAAYATGMPLREIEVEMGGLSTATLFHDRVRDEVPLQRKTDDSTNYVGPEFGLRGGQLVLPRGAVSGVALEAVLRRLSSYQRDQDFDQLPIRFRAVATDVDNAQMVVLDHGSLSVAMRASMAIPAVLEPVDWQGRLLIDGGVSRNLPVDVARALGAQVIIAVDIGTPLRQRGEITSLLDMTDQMSRILTASNTARSLTELREDDVLIRPDLSAVAATDFDHLKAAAAAGESAARMAAPLLQRYSLDAPSHARYMARLDGPGGRERAGERIAAVEIAGVDRVREEVVRATLHSQPGQRFDPAVAEKDMQRLYGLGDFEHVSYVLSEEPGQGQVLHAQVAEKSWGPQYLRLGLGLSNDFKGDAYFSLLAAHRWTWLNRLGGEWRNEVTLGHTDRLVTEWHQPLSPAQRLFVAGHLLWERRPFDIYSDKVRFATYRRERKEVGLEAGLPLGQDAEARIGLMRGQAKLLADTSAVPGSELIPRADTGGLLLRLRWDSLDNLRFPRKGLLLDTQLYASHASLGAQDEYRKLSLTGKGAVANGPHSLQLGVQLSEKVGSGPLPAYEMASLGGFLQLSGYRTGQLVGTNMRFARLVYNYRIQGPGWLDGAYLGTSAEVGRIGDVLNRSSGTPTLYGSALYVAVDTPLGPIYFGYGRASDGNRAVYLFLGQP